MTFLVDNKEELPVPDDGAPLKILIGPENVNEALKETSVVVASYDIGEGCAASSVWWVPPEWTTPP